LLTCKIGDAGLG